MSHAAVLSADTANLPAVEGRLGFTRRSAERQFTYAYDPPPAGQPRSNIVLDEQAVWIADARAAPERFRIDANGFELIDHRTAVRDFWDEAQTLALGHPEAAEIVKAATGAAPRRGVRPHPAPPPVRRPGPQPGRAAPARHPRPRATRRSSAARSGCAT